MLGMSKQLNRQILSEWVLIALLCLPWLNPFTAGPSPNTWPWLVSATCALLVWLLQAWLGSQVVATAWLLAAVGSSVIGLCQYFGVLQPSVLVNASDAGQAFANLRQRNQFATLTSIGLVSLLWHEAQCHSKQFRVKITPYLRFLGYASALLLALGNAASGSRTGLFQWMLVLAMTFLWRPRGQWRLVGLCAVAFVMYLLAVLTLPWMLQLITGQVGGGLIGRLHEDAGCSSRRVMWANVWHLIIQRPWYGWGWGELDYAHFITSYSGERFCEILDNAHNLPLHLAVELGLPLSAAVCGGSLWLTLRAKPWIETDVTRQLAWGVLAMILFHSLLEYPLWYGPFQMTFAVCIWLLLHKPKCMPELPVARGIAFVLVAIMAYAAWDYHRISQIYLAPEMRSEAYRDNALEKAKASWLFQDQVRFAELTTTEVTHENAMEINALAKEVQHFSPESRVVIKIVESATMLGRNEEAQFYLQRFKAAYPQDHERWAKGNASEDAE
jgi:O-antigen ligase